MFMVLRRLQRLNVSNLAKNRAGEPPCALLGTVEQTKLQRVHPDLLADLV